MTQKGSEEEEQMRIIAGEHRGRPLKAPKGSLTRPTTDRVRESLMSALSSERGGFEGAVVLDAFAGSGGLGLEALSRGAAFACFCEKDNGALRVIEDNVRTLRYDRTRARVQRADVLKGGVPAAAQPYDLVFLDPPYAVDSAEVFALLARLEAAGALDAEAVVSYEHASSASAAVDGLVAQGPFALASRRSFGDTVIDILVRS